MRIETIIVLSLILISCTKELPVMPNPENPCDCQNEVSADFDILERFTVVNGEWLFIPTDTTHHSKTVKFKAHLANANYRWYIGDQQFTGQETEVFVPSHFAGYNIAVTCVVEKEPNTFCFPNDDGYDSIVKSFAVSNYPMFFGSNNPVLYGIEGTYRVLKTNGNATDSIDIQINFGNYYDLYNYIQISNFDGQGTQSLDSAKRVVGTSYRRIDFTAGTIMDYSKSLSGSIVRELNGNSFLTFTSVFKSDPLAQPVTTTWTYEGRKIN